MLGEGQQVFLLYKQENKDRKRRGTLQLAQCKNWHKYGLKSKWMLCLSYQYVWQWRCCYSRMTKENKDTETNFASKLKAQRTQRCVSTHRGMAQVTTLGLWKIQRLKLLVQLYIFLMKSGTRKHRPKNSRHKTFISEGGGEEGSKQPWNLTCIQGFTTDLKTKDKRRHGAEKKIG